MFDKVFIDDVAFFVVRVYKNTRDGQFDVVLIKDKNIGEAWYGSAPIVGVFEIPYEKRGAINSLQLEEIKFIEWAWIGDEG